ncbi:MAG TPA: MBL fold metallo-hydrolase [Anaerolineales bacterium]|nr:MBL fold metallo-hydrolase [Anaerolineales bacterium]HRQ92875.1 MBL fold metallo-hydrolase [Anaerolineales bacterium]
MQHERIAENVYFFQSELYAQVTAGVITGPDMAVLIDTLALPEETKQLRRFIERELRVPVRYIINTHYHADHSWGNCLFPGAKIIGHRLCHEYLSTRGRAALEAEQKDNASWREVSIVPPTITFDEGQLDLQVGKKNLSIFPFPGHSADSIAVLVEEDRILFCGDTFMNLPVLSDGDVNDTIASLKKLPKMGLENLVPGHGEIVLRGEIDAAVKSNLDYLSAITKTVRAASRRRYALDVLETVHVEDCGKSRVLVTGMAEQLHQRNMVALFRQLYGKLPEGTEMVLED